MKSIFSLLLVVLFIQLAYSAPTNSKSSGDRLRLKILNHHPCTSKSSSSERIRFASLDRASLSDDSKRGDGCYSINGPVTVRKSISGTVQIYSQLQFDTKAPIESCRKADSRGCGGIGSCVYCDPCSNAANIEKSSSGLVRLNSNGLDCGKGIAAGNYSNIGVSFCLPSKSDLLEAVGIDEDLWNSYESNGRTFSITLYLFDQEVNSMSPSQLQTAANSQNEHVIGCHKIVGSIFEAD